MKKQLLSLRTMVVALGIIFSGALHAFTATTSGNWSSAATWGGSAPGTNVTGADIIIPAGITVTLDQDVTFSGLLNQFQVNGTLSSSSMNKVTITLGVLTGAGNISIRKLVFTNLSTATFAGTMTLNELHNSSSSLALVGTANVSDSLVLADNALTLNTNGNLSLMTGATVRVDDGSLSLGAGGVFNSSNNYNVMYMGTTKSAGIELNGASLQEVHINMDNNTQSVNLGSNTSINGKLRMMVGRLNLNGMKLTLKGDIDLSAGAMLMSNATSEMVIEGSGSLTSGLAFDVGSSMNDMTINRNTTVKLMSGLAIAGDLYLMNGTYSIESGGTLTMNAGSMIHVSGGNVVTNAGTFAGSASYNVEYIGSTNATSGAELTGTGLNNITVNYASVNSGVSLSSNLVVTGMLDMTSGHVVLNGNNLILNGTFSQNANATFVGHANSELHLNMAAAASPTLYFDNTSAANNTLSKLNLNVGNGTDISLGSQLTVRNDLMLTQNRLMIGDNDLIIQSSGMVSNYNASRYVVTNGTGRLQMDITAGAASYVTFPVGTSNNFSPAHIQQASAGGSGSFMVKTINQVYTAGYTGWDNSASSPVVGRTWMIEAASGVNVNMNLKLGWQSTAELNGFNRNSAMIRHYTNGNWDTDAAVAATTGLYSTYELSRTGFTSLSPFTVADANAAVGIKKNTAAAASFEVYPNPAKDVLIVDLAAGSKGYSFEVIDVTGKRVMEGATTKGSDLVDVSSLKPGVYFIKVASETATGVKRFVKE